LQPFRNGVPETYLNAYAPQPPLQLRFAAWRGGAGQT
jgi:hypothetical protein